MYKVDFPEAKYINTGSGCPGHFLSKSSGSDPETHVSISDSYLKYSGITCI